MGKLKFIIGLMLVLSMASFCSSQKNKRPVAWKETIGTLDPHGHGEGTIHYQVDGNEYSGRFTMRSQDAVLGEKCTMRYNIYKPQEIEIDYWHPVFVAGEQTYPFVATIEKVHKKSFWDPTPFVVYTFEVKGFHIKRAVYLQPNYLQIYPNLKRRSAL
jgi:hypothetical protein